MKVAALSDIHDDFQSLQIVWRSIVARGLSENIVLNAGDTVAYGKDTMRCIDFVRDPTHKIMSVQGNYDRTVFKFPSKQDDYRRKWARGRPDKYAAIKHASDALTRDARAWLEDIPEAVVVEFDGVMIGVSHYAPTGGKEGLSETTSEERLQAIAAEVAPQMSVVVTGHTHMAFARRVGSVLFVNPGSVGLSVGRPAYAEIEINDGRAVRARIIACPE